MRLVAEAAWYPTALLPSQGARWTAVDQHSADLRLDDCDISVMLRCRFDPDSGLLTKVRAQARARLLAGVIVMTPWESRRTDYAQRDGMCMPMRGGVAWQTPQGRRAFWWSEVSALNYSWVARARG